MGFRLLSAAALLSAPAKAWARAGGAGGGHSSGGGSDFSGGGGDGLVYLVFELLRAGPVGWIILAVIAFIAYQVIKFQQGGAGSVSIPESHYHNPNGPLGAAVKARETDFAKVFPGETFPAFQAKVTTAFVTIQRSWSEKNIAHMRRFISDGVAQRFNAQFTMMNLLGQTNPITDVRVHGADVAKIEPDGAYDCVDVMIRASATDQFVCAKFPQLNSPGGNEAFTEFWTFVRRKQHVAGKDIFHSESCPQCAAPLTAKLVETARCPYCGSHLNSGEFDWVLSEITQEEDYGVDLPVMSRLAPEKRGVAAVRAIDPSFSAHLLEDKATNAYMELLIGTATGQPDLAKRFTTEQAFADLMRAWPKSRLVYDRLYTRAAEVLRAEVSGTKARAYVGIRYSYHLVDLAHPQASPLDADAYSAVMVLGMGRDFAGGKASGSVYAGTCPRCGAPQKENLSPLCDHCGGTLNDATLDWVIEAVLEPAQFHALPG